MVEGWRPPPPLPFESATAYSQARTWGLDAAQAPKLKLAHPSNEPERMQLQGA